MMARILLTGAWLFAAMPAIAAPGIAPPPGARLPLDLALRTDAGRATTLGQALGGRAAVLVFADYGCTTLCGTAIGLAAAVLPETGLRAGEDYRFLVLGLDPRDGPAAARAMHRAYLGEDSAARFLVGDAAGVARATAALGYHADYDAASDRYDHPLALLVLRPDGALRAVLPVLGADAGALRAALLGEAVPAPLFTQICRGLGLQTFAGVRGQVLVAALAVGALSLLGLLGGGVALLRRTPP